MGRAAAAFAAGWLSGSLPGILLLFEHNGTGLGNALSAPAMGSAVAALTSGVFAIASAAGDRRHRVTNERMLFIALATFSSATVAIVLVVGALTSIDSGSFAPVLLSGLIFVTPVTLAATVGAVLGHHLRVKRLWPHRLFNLVICGLMSVLIASWFVATAFRL